MDADPIVVVGAGHAGCEAAAAAARCGARVVLVSNRQDDIGTMSCNPSIGGIGKGHLVREIDVFDGLMAAAADRAAIHHRMLNRGKGSAVHGPRVQADRRLYRAAMQASLASIPVTFVAGHVRDLTLAGARICGVTLADGQQIAAAAVILTTGTFLGGRLFRGSERDDGGRTGDVPTTTLAAQLRALGLPIGRLKTGTPPRLDGRTIDWAALECQPSDAEQWTFAPTTAARLLPQLACAITHTNDRTHELVRRGMARSPLVGGDIAGRGPRYCPSIEDKVARFAERNRHQLFLEPEGLDTVIIYPNGISTSLPADVQQAAVRSIAGLERSVITQFGYAVEYDYVDPRILSRSLALRDFPGLFLAGQINGTTGYEEAAAQGLVAGINAAAAARQGAPVLFDRVDSYIGVMIDDLTLQGVSEPYRMLTARAEHRLRLRADNASTRLGALARQCGALGAARERALAAHEERLHHARAMVSEGRLEEAAALGDVGTEAIEDARYAPYVDRQRRELVKVEAEGTQDLTRIGDYRSVPGLSQEMVERLQAARPTTLAEAGRIRGVTPAALVAVLLASRGRE